MIEFTLLNALTLLLLGMAGVPHAEKQEIWRGNSAGFSVVWTKSDIVVSRAGKQVVSFRDAALREWREVAQKSPSEAISGETSFRILSLAGTVLTVEEERYCDCGGAHPSDMRRFLAVSLVDSRSAILATARLTSWFSSHEILRALLSDPLVRATLQQENVSNPTKSLNELLNLLNFETVRVGECPYLFNKNMLEAFAFFSDASDRAEIRISLSHAAEICRGQLTQIHLSLPATGELGKILRTAEREHRLMDAMQKFSDEKTIVPFGQ
jgi:hypothetical protein